MRVCVRVCVWVRMVWCQKIKRKVWEREKERKRNVGSLFARLFKLERRVVGGLWLKLRHHANTKRIKGKAKQNENLKRSEEEAEKEWMAVKQNLHNNNNSNMMKTTIAEWWLSSINHYYFYHYFFSFYYLKCYYNIYSNYNNNYYYCIVQVEPIQQPRNYHSWTTSML